MSALLAHARRMSELFAQSFRISAIFAQGARISAVFAQGARISALLARIARITTFLAQGSRMSGIFAQALQSRARVRPRAPSVGTQTLRISAHAAPTFCAGKAVPAFARVSRCQQRPHPSEKPFACVCPPSQQHGPPTSPAAPRPCRVKPAPPAFRFREFAATSAAGTASEW